MGRPYASELASLPETYRWSTSLDIAGLAAAVRRTASSPLLVIGSGGSLSAAQLAVGCHEALTGQIARTATPLQAVASAGILRRAAVGLFSAGGTNADIRAAFEAVRGAEPPVTWLLSCSPRSPLVHAAQTANTDAVVAASPPGGRDGFLATNSLLAFSVITYRAYISAFAEGAGCPVELPGCWTDFAGEAPTVIGAPIEDIWAAATIVVLHGSSTYAAAVDFESKCTEAGLAQVQLADYRNFAHGRHHWLAKHPATAVLAIVAPEDGALARRTLDLIPRSFPRLQLQLGYPGLAGGLRAVIDVIRLVQSLGEAKGIDPGRPGVPAFGAKLYSFRGIDLVRSVGAPEPDTRSWSAAPPAEAAIRAIERKSRRPFHGLAPTERKKWLEAYAQAVMSLTAQQFVALAFDYDGTLVDPKDRFQGPRPEVTDQLHRLLEGGLVIGIVTGRGRSAGDELRDRLPATVWNRVLMGYYNGGEIASLARMDAPDRSPFVTPALTPALAAIVASARLGRIAAVTPRPPQITLEPNDPARTQEVWDATEAAILRAGAAGRLVRSSHSIDVLAPGVSKMALIPALRALAGAEEFAPVLRIGDRGAWPGNDAELLSDLDGLSVDQVSSDPTAAWNLSPLGLRGAEATLTLLAGLTLSGSGARLVLGDGEVGAAAPRRQRAPQTWPKDRQGRRRTPPRLDGKTVSRRSLARPAADEDA